MIKIRNPQPFFSSRLGIRLSCQMNILYRTFACGEVKESKRLHDSHQNVTLMIIHHIDWTSALNRFYTIAHRYDNIKVVELPFFALGFSCHSTMLSGLSEFPTNHFFIKFSLFKNIRNLLQIYNKFRINHQNRLRK